MLKHLQVTNVGPSQSINLDFSEGVNIITGDNGLGKSFILDVAWWALTRQWPQDINPMIWSGRMAYPPLGESGTLEAVVSGKTRNDVHLKSTFDRKLALWPLQPGRPTRQGLVIYAMLDGSFSVWDPARNYWRDKQTASDESLPAFVFTQTEAWRGKEDKSGRRICNGLLDDLLYWVMEKGEAYNQLNAALKSLSPPNESMALGGIERMMDAQRCACIKMPYKQRGEVPVVLLSSAIKRVLAMAYFLVWAWQEHKIACRKGGEAETSEITLIVDEIEAHLHPRWQRSILQMLQKTLTDLTGCVKIQYIISTHSPLVMASCEDFFSDKDTWIDIDLKDGDVLAKTKEFTKKGDVNKWLLSDAFDLQSARSDSSQEALDDAAKLMNAKSFDAEQARKVQKKLESALPSRDSFWLRWNIFLAKNNFSIEND